MGFSAAARKQIAPEIFCHRGTEARSWIRKNGIALSLCVSAPLWRFHLLCPARHSERSMAFSCCAVGKIRAIARLVALVRFVCRRLFRRRGFGVSREGGA